MTRQAYPPPPGLFSQESLSQPTVVVDRASSISSADDVVASSSQNTGASPAQASTSVSPGPPTTSSKTIPTPPDSEHAQRARELRTNVPRCAVLANLDTLKREADGGDRKARGRLDALVSNFCPVYKLGFTAPVETRCGHIMRLGCASSWFKRRSTCPTCRQINRNDRGDFTNIIVVGSASQQADEGTEEGSGETMKEDKKSEEPECPKDDPSKFDPTVE